jgi:secreted protein with Ig-like and vWFA domain
MIWNEMRFEYPWAFAMLAVAPLVFWLALRSYAYLGRGRRIASASVRVVAIAALSAALAFPVVPLEQKRLCRAVAVDTSLSVPDEALERALGFVREAERLRGAEDTLVVLGFSSSPRFLAPEEWASLARRGDRGVLDEETDVLAAATYARSVLPEDCSRRLVIVTDGHDTVGEEARLEAGLGSLGMPVDVVGASGEEPVEVIVEDLHAPARVKTHRPFRLRASLHSSEARDVTVRLDHTGPSGGRDTVEERVEHLDEGTTTLTFITQVDVEGEHLFRVEVDLGGGEDMFPENNFYEAATDAAGPPTILYVEGEPSKGTHLKKALETAGFEVDLRGAGGLPASAEELAEFTAVVVSDVPKASMSGGRIGALKGYVKAGGVFVFAGGKKSYQMGGYRGSALEPLLPVSLDVPTDVEKTSAAVILVIDTSGSMSGSPIAMAREAAQASVAVLQPDDLVEVINFDSSPRRLFMMQKAKNQMMINSFIAKLRSGGGTDIVKALDLAYRDISPVQAKKKHIVLLTDGQSSTAGIDQILQNASSEGITISTIGLGASVQRSFLEKIANATGGKASFTNDAKNLPRLFMREMRIVTPAPVVEGVMKVGVARKAPFLAKLGGGFPYLRGYNLVTARGGSAAPVLVSDRGDPVLAMWKQGQGWCVAFTSDVKARWAAPWVKWKDFARFWNALIRSLVKTEKKTDEVHNIEFEREGRLVTATVDLVDRETGLFIDGMEGTLEVKPFSGDEIAEAEMAQVAPGRYQGTFLAESYGTFLARVDFTAQGDVPQPAAGSLRLPYPAEFRKIGVKPAGIRALAAAAGGRADPSPADLWKEERTLRAQVAFWPWALVAFLVLLPVDLAVRRL